MRRYFPSIVLLGFLFIHASCENREVNADDGPNFREIHEDIGYHFDNVNIDGITYYLLERDRNNPHEGFGFMALDGRDMRSRQDTTLAYIKTLFEMQIRMSAKINKTSYEQSEGEANELLDFYMGQIITLKDSSKRKSRQK